MPRINAAAPVSAVHRDGVCTSSLHPPQELAEFHGVFKRTHLHVTRHTSYVTRHASHVTRHTSHVTSHLHMLCSLALIFTCCSVLRVRGLWFVVCGLWFAVYGLWFRNLRLAVCGLKFAACGWRTPSSGSGRLVYRGLSLQPGAGMHVLGLRVWGLGFGGLGFEIRGLVLSRNLQLLFTRTAPAQMPPPTAPASAAQPPSRDSSRYLVRISTHLTQKSGYNTRHGLLTAGAVYVSCS